MVDEVGGRGRVLAAAAGKLAIVITRRSFAQLTAVGMATAALRSPASTVKLHIGIGAYSYHNLSMEEMILQLTALGIREIEMSRGELMLMNHPAESMFHSAKAKLDKAGIRCVSYYPATIKEESDLDQAIRFGKILGVKNITGDATGSMLNRVDQRLTQEGLTFGIHNHYFPHEKFAYETPEEVMTALAPLSQTVGATADIGHFASCGHDPVDALRKLAPRLKLVHLKDIQAAGGEINVLLGKGISKIPQVMQELHRQNFAGLVAVEYEKEGDIKDDMRQEIEFARKLA
jgi:sugar phosphate isomerase/epimerase